MYVIQTQDKMGKILGVSASGPQPKVELVISSDQLGYKKNNKNTTLQMTRNKHILPYYYIQEK